MPRQRTTLPLSLDALPLEILRTILEHLPRRRHCAYLLLACRPLRAAMPVERIDEDTVRITTWRGGEVDGEVDLKCVDGTERMVRIKSCLTGAVRHFEGVVGEELCVRAEHSNGIVQHYEGLRGQERKVRADYSNGKVAC